MTPSSPGDFLQALTASPAWPVLRVGLHAAFFVAAFFILKLIYDTHRATRPTRRVANGRPLAVGLIALALLFAAVLAYQATWQLGGVFRPDFIAFMQSHDRRQFNPAHRIQRGRILDRRGVVLAYSQEHQGQVYRLYPYGPAFAHVVGYSHPRFGATGLEGSAAASLNGGAADSLPAWTELGRQILVHDKRPRGQDLAVTLDAELQLEAVELLGERRGAVVMLSVGDGAVRILASTPGYDPNRITSDLFRDPGPGAPLLNRATQGLYPPGSTFKILPAAMALEAGFKGTLHCPADGYTTSARYRKIRDHEYYSARRDGRTWKGHGNLDLSTALAESSNVFFAQLGVRYGHAAFGQALDRFWFNRQIPLHATPVGSITMRTGSVPTIAPTDLYGLAQASVGQGKVLATPAHMALIAAAVANRGLAMRPRLVAADPPAALAQFMSAADAERLSGMLRRAVREGTGRGIETEGLAIAGKTGTAQNPQGASHSWFVGFAPAGRPALAVAVMVEHGGYGSATAAPIARDLLLRAGELGLLR